MEANILPGSSPVCLCLCVSQGIFKAALQLCLRQPRPPLRALQAHIGVLFWARHYWELLYSVWKETMQLGDHRLGSGDLMRFRKWDSE